MGYFKYKQRRPYKDLKDMEACENRYIMMYSVIDTILILLAIVALTILK